jgi:hypothetical protein
MGEGEGKMAVRPWRALGTLHDHRHPVGSRGCLYETALREAIATQYGLGGADLLELRACEGCGKPYLLQSVWQPFAEEGELACPRCGAPAASWNGPRASVAYWHRDTE